MGESKREVKTFEVDYVCDECGSPMRPTGVALMSFPAKYPHECGSGHKMTFLIKYPTISTEYVSNETGNSDSQSLMIEPERKAPENESFKC